MRTGNLAEPVLKRSVFRQLNMEIAGVRGHYGADCVPLYAEQIMIPFCAVSGPVPGSEYDPGYQMTEAVNRLWAGGVSARSLMIQAVLPETYEESDLRADMKQIAAASDREKIKIEDVQIQVSAGVLVPQYFMTAVGYEEMDTESEHHKKTETASQEKDTVLQSQQMLRPGQELVMTKWIALAGTALLAEQHEEELHVRYPFSLIDRAKEFGKLSSVAEEARAITHFGACAMHHLSQGGIFNALWEMADRAGVGLEVDMKKIPVKQETIEICEYFDINPYYLYSAGSLLIGTDRAEALIAQLASMGIPAAVIGRATDGNDRVIRNGEDCRFLDRPKQDEWYRYREDRKHV